MDNSYNIDRIQRDLNKVKTDISLDSFLFTDSEQRSISQRFDDFERFIIELYQTRK